MENKESGFWSRIVAWAFRVIPIVALLSVTLED